MKIDTKFRSEAPELMDDFHMEGEILRDALDKIASINQLLGGNKVTLEGIKTLLKDQPKTALIRITDVGCGNGDMLRTLADFAKTNQLKFQLKGIDANQFTVDHAKSLSTKYTNITYECKDIFEHLTNEEECEIMLYTLTLHHFKNTEIINLLQKFKKVTTLGIVVNDLERSALAYRLFTALSFVFKLNHMSREDGLVSILRGFKKADLEYYEKELGVKTSYIKWKWAFRYLWIIKTT